MKYLYPYECEKKNLSTPSELQAAIDGNRREGRRSSYGAFGDGSMPTQLQMVSFSFICQGLGNSKKYKISAITNAAFTNPKSFTNVTVIVSHS